MEPGRDPALASLHAAEHFKLNTEVDSGMAGVPAARRRARLPMGKAACTGVMLGFALLASCLPLYLTEVEADPDLRAAGRALEWVVFLGFAAELTVMLAVTRQKLRYLLGNWLDVLIVLAAGLSIAGHDAEWVAWTRLLRMATAGMVLARAATEIRTLFSRGGLPYILGFAVLAMLVAGAGFYWLDPSIHSLPKGCGWLSSRRRRWVTAIVVPTTTAVAHISRSSSSIIGLALLSVVTASVAAFFIGEDEKLLRREMHTDIRHLRDEVTQLIGDERALRRDMHADIKQLRDEVRACARNLSTARSARTNGEAKQNATPLWSNESKADFTTEIRRTGRTKG